MKLHHKTFEALNRRLADSRLDPPSVKCRYNIGRYQYYVLPLAANVQMILDELRCGRIDGILSLMSRIIGSCLTARPPGREMREKGKQL